MSSKIYNLEIDDEAEDEVADLPQSVRTQFRKKLDKLVHNPYAGKRLGGPLSGFFKVVAMRAGYRLVYEIKEEEGVLLILAAGKRADDEIYEIAKRRLGR